MAILHWALKDITYQVTATGVEIKVFTFQPCHLWMRWTTTFPQVHSVPVIRRGLAMYTDKRFCFVAYKDNEQSEGNDTYVHTFLKEPWPVCETRYFYFHGKMGGEKSRSTSCIFSYHRLAPPITKYFYPDPDPELTSVDGHALVTGFHGTWAELMAHPGTHSADFASPIQVNFGSSTILDDWTKCRRTIILFDTSVIPLGSTILSAKLSIYIPAKADTDDWKPSLVIVSSDPASNTALEPADYSRLGSTHLSNEIEYDDIVPLEWHHFILNSAGLNAIKPGGITKLGIRESKYDIPVIAPTWGRNATFTVNLYSSEEGQAWGPKLEVTYK